MGNVWLTDLPTWLSSAGLRVDVYDDKWTTRSRSSGGYEQVLGIGIHHDAGSVNGSEKGAADYGWKNADDRPIGAIRLWRDGHILVGAAGATNTMGKGGPLKVSKGTIPQDQGNLYMLAIEAANNGVGEPWATQMIDAYLQMVWTLCQKLGLKHSDVYSHAGYCQPTCPGRKIDPAGPTPGYPNLGGTSGAKTWPDSAFRAYLDQRDGTHPPEPTPPPSGGGTYTVVAGDSWWGISQKLGCTMDELVAANPPKTSATVIHPGDKLNVPGSAPAPPPTDWMKIGQEATTPPGNPELRQGVVHSNVTWLQSVLYSMDCLDVRYIDGDTKVQEFGPATKAGTQFWQGQNGCTADGVYGPKTASKMAQVRGK